MTCPATSLPRTSCDVNVDVGSLPGTSSHLTWLRARVPLYPWAATSLAILAWMGRQECMSDLPSKLQCSSMRRSSPRIFHIAEEFAYICLTWQGVSLEHCVSASVRVAAKMDNFDVPGILRLKSLTLDHSSLSHKVYLSRQVITTWDVLSLNCRRQALRVASSVI